MPVVEPTFYEVLVRKNIFHDMTLVVKHVSALNAAEAARDYLDETGIGFIELTVRPCLAPEGNGVIVPLVRGTKFKKNAAGNLEVA